jgi:hypothetical protein
MDPGARRSRTWQILRLFLLGVLLVLGAGHLWNRSVESRRGSRIEQRVAELRGEAEARCRAHPLLRGSPISGNAWDDYLEAIEIMKGQDLSEISKFASRLPDADRTKAEAALRPFGAAPDLMQMGTRRVESRRVRIHEEEQPFTFGLDIPLGRTLCLSEAAVCRARFLPEEGMTHQAAELLLDCCRFGQDVVNDGSLCSEWIGASVCRQALIGLKEVLCSGRVAPDGLRQIDGEREAGKNDFAKLFTTGETGEGQARRENLTQLRLLRTGAHEHATGEVLELEDPFGTILRHAKGADRLKIWGIGWEGKDDGGKGEWPNMVREDIVLEIPPVPDA